MKDLLKEIWKTEAAKCTNACHFQTMMIDSLAEIWVCNKAVLYDYAPNKKEKLDTCLAVDDLPLKVLEDTRRVWAENMFYQGIIHLEDYGLLSAVFLNDGPGPQEQALSAFNRNGQTAYYKCALPWGEETSFQWLRKVLYSIPDTVQEHIKDVVTLKELNAGLVRLKGAPDLALLLGSSTSWMLVTMSRDKPTEPVNEQLFIGGIQYRLDGWNHETQSFTRLVEASTKSMRGLANPTKAAQQAITAPAQHVAPMPEPAGSPGDSVTVEELKQAQEPQVEEVQPEQAQQIATEAPPSVEKAPIPETRSDEPVTQPQEEEKRKRIRKAPMAATPANAKALEDTIAYLGSPVADTMTQEEIDEEVRKCRDLGIVLARRMANLYAAGTQIPKKKLAAVSAILN